MSEWISPPEPMAWVLPRPLQHGQNSYASVTLRAPTAGDILKASAIPGATAFDMTLRLISAISLEGVPYDALLGVPAYLIEQMSAYLDMFGGAPLPDPLEQWRSEQAERAKVASSPPAE